MGLLPNTIIKLDFTYLVLFLIVYGQEKVYQDNIEASVSVLEKLSDDWKELSTKLSPHDPLRDTIKNLKQKVVLQAKVLDFQFIASGIALQPPRMDWLNCVLLY